MKTSIHPAYFNAAQVVCSCGSTFTTGSTKENIHVEVCFKCHPLYTGEKRYIDTLGQVGKFEEKVKKAAEYKAKYSPKKKDEKNQENKPKSLRDLLMEM